ncbi:MAG: hypothetical protein CMJ89_10075 [Planctomycetes bacterium]|nr:hypothetical protein [Planctomycetota bacterium]
MAESDRTPRSLRVAPPGPFSGDEGRDAPPFSSEPIVSRRTPPPDSTRAFPGFSWAWSRNFTGITAAGGVVAIDPPRALEVVQKGALAHLTGE